MASELKVDKFTGVTTADVINITTGSTTTVLQTGIAKVLINGTLLSGANTINSSMNITSVTDNGTGDAQLNFTTSFANLHYVGLGLDTYGNKTMASDLGSTDSSEHGTGLIDVNMYNNDPTAGSLGRVDVPYNYGFLGDLA
jgi:hypothetical protein